MVSIDDKEAFEKYYQKEYDFNTESLSETEVYEIKKLVREKRINYANAPIGDKIFELIISENSDIKFETVDLASDMIDGMLYIPGETKSRAYIILNSKKPLINQIFASAHEYYHYLMDYPEAKKNAYICGLGTLKNVNEKKASRFAAEFLLPEDALKNEVKTYCLRAGLSEKQLEHTDWSALSIILTVKYQMPLKAVIYRLFEEKYIDNVSALIDNYEVIKSVLQELKIYKDKVDYLYSTKNVRIDNEEIIYRQMRDAYITGFATREEIINDADELGLDTGLIRDFFEDMDDEEDESDDVSDLLGKLWG